MPYSEKQIAEWAEPQRIDMTSFFDAEKGTRGNCLSACLAMVFHLPLEIVPHFAAMHESEWMERLRDWLTFGNWGWNFETDGTYPEGYYIANGPAKRGVRHSVVMHDGKLFHDPHPSREGLLSIDSIWWFPSLIAAVRKETREECARVAEREWQNFSDTKEAHERLSTEPFRSTDFGFDYGCVMLSKHVAAAIRNLQEREEGKT